MLAPGVTLAGTVVDASGNPMPNAQVNLMSEDGIWIGNSRSNQEGKFTFANVPEGLRAKLSGYVWTGGAHVQFQHDGVVEAGATDVKVEVK